MKWTKQEYLYYNMATCLHCHWLIKWANCKMVYHYTTRQECINVTVGLTKNKWL